MAFGRKKSSTDVASMQMGALGMLQSDLDEPTVLPLEFARCADDFSNFRSRYEKGDLSKAAYGGLLKALQLATDDGAVWTIGARTGRWYKKYPGGSWVNDIPPEDARVQGVGGEHYDLVGELIDQGVSFDDYQELETPAPVSTTAAEALPDSDKNIEVLTTEPTRVKPPANFVEPPVDEFPKADHDGLADLEALLGGEEGWESSSFDKGYESDEAKKAKEAAKTAQDVDDVFKDLDLGAFQVDPKKPGEPG